MSGRKVSPRLFDSSGVFSSAFILLCGAVGAAISAWTSPQESNMSAVLFEEKIGGVSGFGSHPRIARADALRNLRKRGLAPSTFSINGQSVVIWCEIDVWKWGFLNESGKVVAVHECGSEDSARRVAVMELCRRAVDATAVVTPAQIPKCMEDSGDREQFWKWCVSVRQHTPEGRIGFSELVRPSGHF